MKKFEQFKLKKMRTEVKWQDTIPTPPVESGFTNTVWAVCYRPDGSQVLVAVGDRVFIYNAHTGEVVDSKRAHKDVIYALAYSKDGQRWASGGADNNVVVWSSEGVGLLKYSHLSKIQALVFNPVLQSLASCTDNDFGLWQTEGANVQKFQTKQVKCLCADWSPDGQILAIGLFNGTILLRDKNGNELTVIQKSIDPVWTLSFCPQKFDTNDNLLIAGSWDQKLSIFSIAGGKTVKPIGADKELGFDPCSIAFYPSGEFFVLTGSDKQITLWNKEGVKLGKIGELQDWVWGVCVNQQTNAVFAGSNNGDIVSYRVNFERVHGLYQERYAYRELMTDVIIQHLVTETRVKIRCRDYIKKIAIYKDRLAVQLPEKIIIYSVLADDPFDMKYKAFKKINKKVDCTNLFVTSQHLVFIFDKKIQLLAFTGILVREWILEDHIRFVRVVSGPPKQESLIVGLSNGLVTRIFIDNAFPVPIVRQTTGIAIVDMSADKTKIAIIDEHQSMFVYDIKSQQLLFQETQVVSTAWNLEMDDMLAYTTKDTLYIKTREMPASQQKLPGFVVGFKGSKIFCLSDTAMNTIDVPQSSTFYRFLEKKDFDMSYKLACIGVTIQDWKALGVESLLAKNFVIARKAFCHIKDLGFIDLCETADQMSQMRNLNETWLQSEVLALQGKFKDAAANYVKNQMLDKAITLYTQLKKFQEANDLIRKHGKNRSGEGPLLDPQILIKQAEFERDSDNWKEAAELYIQAGKHKEAIEIYGKRRNLDAIMDVCKNLDRQKHVAEIELCAKYFRQAGHHTFAKQAYLRLGDLKQLMKLHVECEKWDEAFMLAKQNPDMESMIYLPYADWLSANDKFDQAQEAYKKANRPDLSLRIIEFLTQNAITEKRYQDAAQYYWLLSTESLKLVQTLGNKASKDDKKHIANFNEYLGLAEIYQAYHLVNRYIDETSREVIQAPLFCESAFNASRFLSNNLKSKVPAGINLVFIYYTLAKLGFQFEAFKTARFAFDKLQSLKIPEMWQEDIDIDALKVRCKPNTDREGFSMNVSPLATITGDAALNIGLPPVYNFGSFDSLPLVEFVPANQIHPKRILELLKADPSEDSYKKKQQTKPTKGKQAVSEWNQDQEQVISFSEHADVDNDAFTIKLLDLLDTQSSKDYKPIEVDEYMLKSLRYEEVYILDYSHFNPNYPKRYFKNIVPDVAIYMCENCCKFFIQDEYEFAYMELGHCPFCKHVEKDKGIKNVYGSLSDMHQ